MKLLKIIVIIFLTILISCQEKQQTTQAEVSNPQKPHAPIPENNSKNIELTTNLSWQCDNAISYDLYLDTENPPINLYSRNLKDKTLKIYGLSYATTYYWKIVAKFSDSTTTESEIWKFTTKDRANTGYRLHSHNIETQLPAFVNIMFQVTDMDGRGIEYLTTEDFEVREDDQPVSPTESAMQIRKKDVIPYTLKTVLLLDNSASVGSDLEEIKNAAKGLVENITTQQEIAIYKFSDHAVLLQDFTNDVSKLVDAINSIDLGFATTDLYGSIIEGVSRWKDIYSTNQIQQGFLVALTDGSDTQGSHTLNEALKARADKKIYTVGLGNEIDPQVLQKLGNAGFYSITDVSQLVTKFKEIQSDMALYANSFYWLNYMSPKRGDNNHTLKLFVKNNVNNGPDSYITGEFNSSGFYSVYSGLYINPTNSNPYGIDTLQISEDDTISISAVTYLGNNPPQYQWASGNESLILVEPNLSDPSIASVIAVGDSGQTTTITVEDVANNLSKTIDVVITKNSIPADGLVAYYPFNGNANDESGNGNDGTAYGATLTTDRFGNENSAYYFDGNNDYIDVGSWEFGGPCTFSVWVYYEAFHRWSRLLDFGNGPGLENIILSNWGNTSDIWFEVYTPSSKKHVEINNGFSSNTWLHIVAVVKVNSNMLVYVNAEKKGDLENGLTPSILNRSNQYFGKSNWRRDGYFNGKLDDIRIYNRALTEEEISALYHEGGWE